VPFSLPKRHLPTAIFVALLILINLLALPWTASFLSRKNVNPVLRYGQRMPELAGESLTGDQMVKVPPGKTNLVIYLSAAQLRSRSIELAKYAEILWQRYGMQGLEVTVIIYGSIPDLDGLIGHSMVNYRIIMDANGSLGERLGLYGKQNGVFFFDPEGYCLLGTDVPLKAEDLRQLVAVEFLRTDPFDKALRNQRAIEEGQPLGSWPLSDVRSWEQTTLDRVRDSGANFFLFFTAECSVCSLSDYLRNYAEFEQHRRSPGGAAEPVVLVFDFNFPRIDVLDQLRLHKIESPAYIANEELTAVADLGRMKSFDNGQVVAAQTDGKGSILKLSSFDALRPEAPAAPGDIPAMAGDVMAESPRSGGPRAAFKEMFGAVPLAAYDVASHGGKYFVTDVEGNRILVFDENMHLEREIGRIGSGPGRLLHPGYIDVGRDGTLYIQDGGNDRIQRLSASGEYLGELRTADYEGFAVGAGDEIYLGQPESGSLVTVYSKDGQALRSFGQLKKYSDIYGPQSASKDEAHKIAVNRVRLTTDGEGNIYVSFLNAPLLQKYSPHGELIFERRLEGDKIAYLQKVLETKKYISTGREGVEARAIALDPLVDRTIGHILVLLVDGSIYVADRDGRKIDIIYEQTDLGLKPFYPFMAGLGVKGEVVIIPFQHKRCYRLVTPVWGTNADAAARPVGERV
jgi:hypothetical protein